MQNKRGREEGGEPTYVWEPFLKRASSPELSRKRGFPTPVSDFSQNKRPAPVVEDFARAKRPLDAPDVIVDPQGFKRCKPVYWTAPVERTKRKADDIDALPWLEDVVSKRSASGFETPGDGALIVYGDRANFRSSNYNGDMALSLLHKYGDGEDDMPWFSETPLSRIPNSLFRVSPPETRVTVWQDPNEVLRRVHAPWHPPMAAEFRSSQHGPRVEVLESDDEDEEFMMLHDDDGSVRPMDLDEY